MKRFLLLLIIVLSCCLSWAQDWVSKYDEVGVFENDRAYVRLKKKYGYVDSNGKEVIPCTYSSVGAFNEHGIVWVNKDGKYGIYNHDGKVILPVKYDAVSFFQRDRRSEDGNPYYMFRTLSNVESDNSRYSKNIDGKLFVNDKGLKWVGKGCGKFGIYSPSNNTVLKPFEKLSTDEYIAFSTSSDNDNRKWGVCDLNGDIIIPCDTYDFCYYPSEGFMPVAKIIDGRYSINYVNTKTKSLVFENFIITLAPTPVVNGKILIMDDTGCYFINMKGEKTDDTYDAVFPSDNEDIYTVYKDSNFGTIKPDGHVIVDIKYKLMSTADNGLICYVDKDENGKSKYGFMNMSGEIVTPPKYSAIKRFENKRAIVRQGDLYGCIDTTGREILPCKFYTIYLPKSPETDIYFVKEEKNGNIYAYKAYTTTRLYENSFKNVRNYDQDYKNVAFVSQIPPRRAYEYVGCIDKSGEMLIPCICPSYDNAFKLYNKRQMEGKYKWTEHDERCYNLVYYNDYKDFDLLNQISEKYWDF